MRCGLSLDTYLTTSLAIYNSNLVVQFKESDAQTWLQLVMYDSDLLAPVTSEQFLTSSTREGFHSSNSSWISAEQLSNPSCN